MEFGAEQNEHSAFTCSQNVKLNDAVPMVTHVTFINKYFSYNKMLRSL